MKVLDVCCGAEKMYHGMQERLAGDHITMDIRHGDDSYESENQTRLEITIDSDVIANMRAMPFKDGVFNVVVCDPPHMKCGLTGFMGKKWGSWNQQDTIDTMHIANTEFSRVLKIGGTLILKIMPDLVGRYEKMLTSFIFYLPIQTVRPNGRGMSKESRNAAIWLIGVKR